jgi:hypothetical protein
MPCIPKTGNVEDDSNCLQAEMTRQVAVAAAGNNQAAMTAAKIQFFKTVRDSAFTNGLPHAQFMEALRQLGVARTRCREIYVKF